MNKMGSKYGQWLIAVILLFAVSVAQAGIAVIGHSGDTVGNLTEHQVKDFYLGKVTAFNDGTHVDVIDLPEGNAVRDQFYDKVVGKSKAQVQAYWAKRIFTGKGTPPKSLEDAAAVKKWVAEKPGRLGYIDSSAVDDSVSVLLQIQ
ncbi:MAG: phosphate ABC transporter substrate-binding protein [Gammaproteobacteria bacterium]|nr:phosphate ABC transporter substrate-binding protein [Gammaproteobacteria bacterium]